MSRIFLSLFITCTLILSTMSVDYAQAQGGEISMNKIKLLKGEKIQEGLLGFGVENNVFLFTSSNKMVTEEQKNIVEDYISHLKPKMVRIFLDTTWWDPTRTGKYIWEWEKSGVLEGIEKELGRPPEYSVSMQALYRVLNFYEKLNIPVNLVMWRPNDWDVEQLPQMVKSVIDLLRYLIEEKRFSNIHYLTLYNEPDAEFRHTPKDYINMYNLMAKNLDQSNLEVKLIGGDTTQYGLKFLSSTLTDSISNIVDHFSFHQYIRYNIPMINYLNDITKVIKEIRKTSNKPIVIWEFNLQGEGAGTYTSGYAPNSSQHILDEYSSSIILTEYIIQCLNAGIAGMSYWEVYDMNYPGGYKMECGLIGYDNYKWRIRPFFYIYQLFTRLIEPEAIVYNVKPELEGITSILIENVSGKIKESLFIVNPQQQSIIAEVKDIFPIKGTGLSNSQWILWSITQERIEESIRSELLSIPEQRLNSIPSEIEIPSRGIVVLSRYLQ